MKKLIIMVSTLCFISNSAFAKTQGNYLGIYSMLVKVSHKDQSNSMHNIAKDSTRKVRLGFNYQHAFNFNGIFIAPEVFLDAIESASREESDKIDINTRYGIKANIGYDVNDNFSPYFTFGRGVVEYSSVKSDFNESFEYIENKKTGSVASNIYGIGVNFHIHDSLSANIEYNKQNLDLDQGPDFGKFKSSIDSLKFGVAYHF